MGPFRVWDKFKNAPGIAMSRSIGDFYAKGLGVIADVFITFIIFKIIQPEIKIFNLDEGELTCIIIASDGVWERVTSQDAVDIAQSLVKKGVQEAANMIVKVKN